MKKVILALIVGFVGATLLAPKSGRALRRDFWNMMDKVEAELDKELRHRGLL